MNKFVINYYTYSGEDYKIYLENSKPSNDAFDININSMNKHIGYILYGNHINPPKGYGYIEDILK